MNAYLYDENGYYAGVGTAEPGDVPESWLIPRNATLDEPPEVPEGTIPRWNGTAWDLAVAADFEQAREDAARRDATDTILLPRLLKTTAETSALTDEELAAVGRGGFFDPWEAGESYGEGKRLTHDGLVWIVRQDVPVALTTQPPGGDGMLAIYQPVDPASGTEDDPKTLVIGMAAHAGTYFLYRGELWKCVRDLGETFAGRMPGDAGMETYWEKVSPST